MPASQLPPSKGLDVHIYIIYIYISIIISYILISNCNRINSKQGWFLIERLHLFQGTEHPIDSEIIASEMQLVFGRYKMSEVTKQVKMAILPSEISE